MGGSSGTQPQQIVQQQQNQDPWGPSQQYLLGAMNSASSLYNSDQVQRPYLGPTQAALSDYTTQALGQQASLAQQNLGGTPNVLAAQNLAGQQIKDYGLSPEQQKLYEQISTTQNPFLQDILNTNSRQIADKVNSTMSGAGRYGSGQHTDVLTRALAESANPILAQDYATRQQQRLGLLGEGLQRAGQFSQFAPSLDEARYAPAQHLEAVGNFYSNRSQQALNDQIRQYEANAAYPWESLARYNAIITGAGGLGGTKTALSTQSVPQASGAQRALGGGLAGAGIGSIFGAPGAAVGGLAGAGLGYFL